MKIYIGLLAWLFAGDIFANGLMSLPFAAQSPIIPIIASILSLSDLLSIVSSALSDLMFSLWELIPAFR